MLELTRKLVAEMLFMEGVSRIRGAGIAMLLFHDRGFWIGLAMLGMVGMGTMEDKRGSPWSATITCIEVGLDDDGQQAPQD